MKMTKYLVQHKRSGDVWVAWVYDDGSRVWESLALPHNEAPTTESELQDFDGQQTLVTDLQRGKEIPWSQYRERVRILLST
jgi:hypothetical protein